MICGTLILTIFSVTIGSSVIFGYQTGVINNPQFIIKNFIRNVTEQRYPDKSDIDDFVDLIISIMVAVFTVGGTLGSLTIGILANNLGRKGTLLLLAVPSITGSLLMGLSKECGSYEMIIAGRFIIGMSSGIYTSLGPMYLAEIAPLKVRGAMGTVATLGVTLAILLSEALGIPSTMGTSELWPYLLGFTILPAGFVLITLPFCPESPSYLLLIKNNEQKARQALQRLRGVPDVDDEISELKGQARLLSSVKSLSVKDLFMIPYLRYALCIGICAHLSQQLAGNNAVLNYSSQIFTGAGLSEETADIANIGIGLIQSISVLIGVFLMDRLGRRTLLLVGYTGSLFCIGVLLLSINLAYLASWISFIPVVSVYAFSFIFCLGPASIPWFYVAEIFTQTSRDSAMTVCITVNWIAQTVIGLGFPQLLKLLKGYAFAPFAGCLVLTIFFTYRFLPETKGRCSEDLEDEFKMTVLGDSQEDTPILYSTNNSSANISS